MARELLTAGLALLLLLPAGSVSAQGRTLTVSDLPMGELVVYGQVIEARMAVTPEHRSTGFRGASPEAVAHEIVYFRFETPGRPAIDTSRIPVPLITAWIGHDNRVVAVDLLEPDTEHRRPSAPVVAALQVGLLNPLARALRSGIVVRPAAALRRTMHSVSAGGTFPIVAL